LTVASLLKRHGYATGCVGKWHLGLGWATKDAGQKANARNIDWPKPVTHGPQSLGFDYSYAIPASLDMDPYCWLENGRVVEAATGHTPGSERRWSGGGGFWRAGAIAPSFDFYAVLPTVTAKSVEFLRRQTTDKPFFLYVALTAPHTPWMPTDEFRGKTRVDWYGDFVTEVDWAVGQIVEAVDDVGFSAIPWSSSPRTMARIGRPTRSPSSTIAPMAPGADRNPTSTRPAIASRSSAVGLVGSGPAPRALRRSA